MSNVCNNSSKKSTELEQHRIEEIPKLKLTLPINICFSQAGRVNTSKFQSSNESNLEIPSQFSNIESLTQNSIQDDFSPFEISPSVLKKNLNKKCKIQNFFKIRKKNSGISNSMRKNMISKKSKKKIFAGAPIKNNLIEKDFLRQEVESLHKQSRHHWRKLKAKRIHFGTHIKTTPKSRFTVKRKTAKKFKIEKNQKNILISLGEYCDLKDQSRSIKNQSSQRPKKLQTEVEGKYQKHVNEKEQFFPENYRGRSMKRRNAFNPDKKKMFRIMTRSLSMKRMMKRRNLDIERVTWKMDKNICKRVKK